MWKAIKRRKTTAIEDALQDLHVWREALKDNRDRVALDFLVNKLWGVPIPQDDATGESSLPRQLIDTFSLVKGLFEHVASSQYLECLSKSHATVGRKRRKMSQPRQDATNHYLDVQGPQPDTSSPTHLLGHFQRHVNHTLAETASHGDLRFADFLNIPFLSQQTFPGAQLGSSHEEILPVHYWTPEKAPIGGTEYTGTSEIWKAANSEPLQFSLISPILQEPPPDPCNLEAHDIPTTDSRRWLFEDPYPELWPSSLINPGLQETPFDLLDIGTQDISTTHSSRLPLESSCPEPWTSAFINPNLLEPPLNPSSFEALDIPAMGAEHQLFESPSPDLKQLSPAASFPKGLLASLIESFLFISVLEFLCRKITFILS